MSLLGNIVTSIRLDRDSLVSALMALSQADKDRNLFGSNGHDYRLNPKLESSQLESFERINRVELPEDYRRFITTIGNGGAGPYYGLFRFGEEDANGGYCTWEKGQLLGDVSKPFPHTSKWNASDDFWSIRPDFDSAENQDAEDEMWERWDEQLAKHYWCRYIMDGSIPICHLGCAKRQWLVINGPERGFVWNDDRCDELGIAPATTPELVRMPFDDWYVSWLQSALAQFNLPQYAPTTIPIHPSRDSGVS